jgi:hypothetical protein
MQKMSRSPKRPYTEGSIFTVPLREGGGFGRGVVARASKRGGILLGYFFGPRLNSIEEAVMDDLIPENAILCKMFSDLGIREGEWKIIGMLPAWDPSEWPMPTFMSRFSGYFYRVTYDSNDPDLEVSRRMEKEDDTTLEDDGLCGDHALEFLLTQRLMGIDDRLR